MHMALVYVALILFAVAAVMELFSISKAATVMQMLGLAFLTGSMIGG